MEGVDFLQLLQLKALWTDKIPTEFGNKLRENRFVFCWFLHAFYKWSWDDQMFLIYCRYRCRVGWLLEYLHTKCLMNFLQLYDNLSEEWSSQYIFQFKQLERRSLKKSRLQRDSNPWPPRYRCDALPTELWSHTLGAKSIYWVHISREEWNDMKYRWNNSYIWTAVVDQSEEWSSQYIFQFKQLERRSHYCQRKEKTL